MSSARCLVSSQSFSMRQLMQMLKRHDPWPLLTLLWHSMRTRLTLMSHGLWAPCKICCRLCLPPPFCSVRFSLARSLFSLSYNPGSGSWREDSAVRSTGCSCRSAGLASHLPHGSSQLSANSSPKDLMPSSDTGGPQACARGVHIYPRRKTLIHI